MKRTVALLLLALTACTASSAATTTTLPAVDERLVVLEDQGTLVTMSAAGSDRVTLVDASDRVVLQPTWSPRGGRLAWAEVVLSGGPEPIAVVTALPDGSARTRTPVSNPPFYLSWSPDGTQLALLRNGAVQLEMGLIDVAAGGEEERVLASGQPFYYSWSPGSQFVFAHVGVGMRLETIGVDGEVVSLDEEPGRFQAPAWVGDRVFWVRDGGAAAELVVSGPTGDDIEVLVAFDGFVHFVVSPDGTRVAYRVLDQAPPAVTAALTAQEGAGQGELVVLDLETRDQVVVDTDNPFAFFWSPDSRKLLYLSVLSQGFRWSVWDDGGLVGYDTFVPSLTLGRDYLPFFDQFAQSIELWAPDSQSFVYAGREEAGGDTGIWLQPIDGDARRIADGVFAAFIPAS